MDRIDDERICFYLRNREDIDQWSMLRKQASQALDSFLQESADEIETLAGQLGEDVITRTSLAGRGSRYIRFLKKGWIVGSVVRAAIVLEWPKTQVLFFPGPAGDRAAPAYVGVWLNSKAAGGSRLVKALGPRLAKQAKKIPLAGGSATNGYPVWRQQTPSDGSFWEDLVPFRQNMIDEIEWFWKRFAADIDGEILK